MKDEKLEVQWRGIAINQDVGEKSLESDVPNHFFHFLIVLKLHFFDKQQAGR